MKLIDRMVEYFTGLNKKMKRWQRVVSILSAIVVFATTYMLVMPAITLDVDTASTQAGIEVASENEPDTAGTVFESTEEEEPEEPEAEPAEEEETTGSVSSAQEEEAEPASEQEEAVESDSDRKKQSSLLLKNRKKSQPNLLLMNRKKWLKSLRPALPRQKPPRAEAGARIVQLPKSLLKMLLLRKLQLLQRRQQKPQKRRLRLQRQQSLRIRL